MRTHCQCANRSGARAPTTEPTSVGTAEGLLPRFFLLAERLRGKTSDAPEEWESTTSHKLSRSAPLTRPRWGYPWRQGVEPAGPAPAASTSLREILGALGLERLSHSPPLAMRTCRSLPRAPRGSEGKPRKEERGVLALARILAVLPGDHSCSGPGGAASPLRLLRAATPPAPFPACRRLTLECK